MIGATATIINLQTTVRSAVSNSRFLPLVLTAVLLLPACGAAPPVPEDQFYRLPPPQATEPNEPLVGTLAVHRLVTDGLHNGRAILYSDESRPLRLKQYHYHHWVDIPPRLVQEHMIAYLREAGAAAMVVSQDPRTPAEYAITGKIQRFEQIKSEQETQVVVGLELQFRDESDGRPVLVREYRETVPAASGDLHEVVRAFGRALERIYGGFLQEIRGRVGAAGKSVDAGQ